MSPDRKAVHAAFKARMRVGDGSLAGRLGQQGLQRFAGCPDQALASYAAAMFSAFRMPPVSIVRPAPPPRRRGRPRKVLAVG